jgi:3-polyprenyl-4-hydroxybenzoate decarboxylase
MINHIVMRALDQFGLHIDPVHRWDGMMTTKGRE